MLSGRFFCKYQQDANSKQLLTASKANMGDNTRFTLLRIKFPFCEAAVLAILVCPYFRI
jgi:hypothetical protein